MKERPRPRCSRSLIQLWRWCERDEDETEKRRSEFLEREIYSLVADAVVWFCVLSSHEGDILHFGNDSPWRLSSLRLADEILRRI